METQPRPPGRALLLIFGIVLLGFLLRLSGLYLGQAYSYFGQGDGVAAYSVAVDFGHGEERALYIGQPNYNRTSKLPGPLWTIFCYLGLRLGGGIQGVIWAVILLNTLLIFLVYLLAARTVGRTAALWAALFVATFPWPIYYSVGVYNPDVMAFVGTLLFLALWRTSQHNKSRSIALVLVLLFALPQFHMSGLMVIPAVVAVLWLAPNRLSVPWLLVGLAGGMALYMPYVLGELAHGWQNTRGMFSGKGGFSWDSLKVLSVTPGLLCNWAPQWFQTMAQHRQMAIASCGFYPVLLALNVVSALLVVLIVAGMSCKIRAALSGFFRAPRLVYSRSPGMAFLVLTCLVPLAFALISGKPFHTRYALVLLAPLMSLAGAGTVFWLKSDSPAQDSGKSRLGKLRLLQKIFMGALVITIAANVWLVPAMYRYEGRRVETSEVLVPSWRKLDSIYMALRAHAGPAHTVDLDDTAYLAAVPSGQKRPERDAGLVRRYVAVREKERLGVGTQPVPRAVYVLSASNSFRNGDPDVAYCGNGIALVARSE